MIPRVVRTTWRSLGYRVGRSRPPARLVDGPVVGGVGMAHACFGRRTDPRDLAAAARRLIGPEMEDAFRRYVDWMSGAGYRFGSCEAEPPRFDAPVVYVRYDVHVRDLPAVFILADLHERLAIPGSFQICWHYSEAEEDVSDIFLKLKAFDPRYVEFGLHCAPESSWLVAERYRGDANALNDFVSSGGADRLIAEWWAAYERDGPAAEPLVEAEEKAERFFAGIVASFREAFGSWSTVSGHGTPLNNAYLAALRKAPHIEPLGRWLHAVDFLDPVRLARHGLRNELTPLGADAAGPCRIMFENPVEEMAGWYGQRMAAGAGFVALFHPATWSGAHFLPFLDRMAPRPPDSGGA
jgi:hypothetical protein